MNTPPVSLGSSVYYFTEQSDKNVRSSTSFSNLMQQMASERAAREGYAAKTPTRDMLDADNLRYLEMYTEIYNKYAEQYGDGFELKGSERVATGDDVGRLEVEKYQAARLAFQQELYNAGIPDESNGILLKVEDLTSGKYTKNGSYTFVHPSEIPPKTGIATIFYAEKYGVAGLSHQEQYAAIMGKAQNSTIADFEKAQEMLSNIGAIAQFDAMFLGWAAYGAADSLEQDKYRGEIGWQAQYNANLAMHQNNIARQTYEWRKM